MSHKNLRKEQNCLNCGHEVEERFCSKCGQENLQLKDSAFHLVLHYIQDLFHYDGKLWHTLKSLVVSPGLVAKEYLEGKRQSHLEPIRFYVFASSVFFLTFFLVLGSNLVTTNIPPEANYSKRLYYLKQEKEFRKDDPDTAVVNQLITSLLVLAGDSVARIPASSVDVEVEEKKDTIVDNPYEMGWLEKLLYERVDAKDEELEKQFDGDEVKSDNAMVKEFVHKLPQLFFLSLPFFAFFLMLLYLPSRNSLYVEHFIFSIYHYAFIFSIMLLYIFIGWLTESFKNLVGEPVREWGVIIMALYPFVYLLLSMKRFYNDTWGWLMVRYFILMMLMLITILILFVVMAFIIFLF